MRENIQINTKVYESGRMRRSLNGRKVVIESTSLLTKRVSASSSLHRRTPPPVRQVRNDVNSRDVTLLKFQVKSSSKKSRLIHLIHVESARSREGPMLSTRDHAFDEMWPQMAICAVSYTHLTLPTILLV